MNPRAHRWEPPKAGRLPPDAVRATNDRSTPKNFVPPPDASPALTWMLASAGGQEPGEKYAYQTGANASAAAPV